MTSKWLTGPGLLRWSAALANIVSASLAGLALTVWFAIGATAQEPRSNTPDATQIAERLVAGYPGIVKSVAANRVEFADGTSLDFDDGKGEKPFAAWLEQPDIEDMFRYDYPLGEQKGTPAADFDPGRARNEAFFTKIYGDCRKSGVARALVDVVWLPKKARQKLKFSGLNHAAERLRAVSAELDALPASFDAHLFPAAGTYNCRAIAGTKSLSAHGLGIAIDISLRHAHYWRWEKKDGAGAPAYRNAIPYEIVRVFEKHGFIWGGKWHHFDTMHFEYRPELLPPSEALPQPK